MPMQLMIPVHNNWFIKCGYWNWQCVLAARQHNSQRAECKQQAVNAPLQYPCLCTFK